MTDQHPPITPPRELVQQWINEEDGLTAEHIATQAARWGWDQRGTANEAELQKARDEELEACCQELEDGIGRSFTEFPSTLARDLRTARRPEAPSLKEQALTLLSQHNDGWVLSPKDWDTILRALEQLP